MGERVYLLEWIRWVNICYIVCIFFTGLGVCFALSILLGFGVYIVGS